MYSSSRVDLRAGTDFMNPVMHTGNVPENVVRCPIKLYGISLRKVA